MSRLLDWAPGALAGALLLSSAAQATLTKTFQQTGTLDIEVAALGFGTAPTASSVTEGTLNISAQASLGIPVQAYLYAMDTNHPGTLAGTFNGLSLPGGVIGIGPHATDAAFNTLYTWRWDVTGMIIPGVTNYGWSLNQVPDQFNQGGPGIDATALVLIYSDPTLTISTATVMDGMTYVGNTHPETESINITGLPAGQNQIHTLTYLDDNINPPSTSGESIVFNGSTVGGPLDKNLFLNASLTLSSGISAAGSNAMSISTNSDEFGWVFTTLLTTPTVPVPAAVWLFGSALGVMGWLRRKATI